MSNIQSILSIDIGGTKVQIIQYSLNLEILKEVVLSTANYFEKKNSSELEELFKDISLQFQDTNFETLGISFNCALYNNKVVYSSLLSGGEGTDLELLCSKFFTFKNFKAENDVVCMANAELKRGLGQKYKNFLFVNLGTGLKVVNCNEGNLTLGYRGTAGEISQKEIWVSELNEYIKADNLTSGKGIQNRIRVILDIEGYKEKREKTLEDLAEKVAKTVIKTKKSVKLEPMQAYERKIIHSKLQQNPQVETISIGEEPYRRVVISLKNK